MVMNSGISSEENHTEELNIITVVRQIVKIRFQCVYFGTIINIKISVLQNMSRVMKIMIACFALSCYEL